MTKDYLSSTLYEITNYLCYEEDNKFFIHNDALPSLKDLHKIIREDLQTLEHPVIKKLNQWHFIKKDLLPLLKALPSVNQIYSQNDKISQKILLYILKILALLSNPISNIIEDKEQKKIYFGNVIEQEQRIRSIKLLFCDKDILGIICSFFQRCILLPINKRTDNDINIIDIILIIICNLLKVSDQNQEGSNIGISTNQHLNQLHINFIIQLEKSKIIDSILYFIKITTTKVNKQHQIWNLRIINFLRLLFKEQDPIYIIIDLLKTNNNNDNNDKLLQSSLPSNLMNFSQAIKNEKIQKNTLNHHIALCGRHPKFGGTFLVTNKSGTPKGNLHSLLEQVHTEQRIRKTPKLLEDNKRSKAYRPRRKKAGLSLGMKSSNNEAPLYRIIHTKESRLLISTIAITIIQHLYGSLLKRIQYEIDHNTLKDNLLEIDFENFLWFTSFFTLFSYYFQCYSLKYNELRLLQPKSIHNIEHKLNNVKSLLAVDIQPIYNKKLNKHHNNEEDDEEDEDFIIENKENKSSNLLNGVNDNDDMNISMDLDELMDQAVNDSEQNNNSEQDEEETHSSLQSIKLSDDFTSLNNESLNIIDYPPSLQIPSDDMDSSLQTDFSNTNTINNNTINESSLVLEFDNTNIEKEDKCINTNTTDNITKPLVQQSLQLEFISTTQEDTTIIENNHIKDNSDNIKQSKTITEDKTTNPSLQLQFENMSIQIPSLDIENDNNNYNNTYQYNDIHNEETESETDNTSLSESESIDYKKEQEEKSNNIKKWWEIMLNDTNNTNNIPNISSITSIQQYIHTKSFLFVTRRITNYIDEKNWNGLQTAISCLRSLLVMINSMIFSKSITMNEDARSIFNEILFDRERYYLYLLPSLLKLYNPGHIPLTSSYLSHILECFHITIRLINHINKDGVIYTLSKSSRYNVNIEEEEEEEYNIDNNNNDNINYDKNQSTIDNEIFILSDYTKLFIHPTIIQNICFLLDTYHSNSLNINHYLAKFIYFICNEHNAEYMFYRLTVFRVLERFLSDPRTKKHKKFTELREICSWIIRRFNEASIKSPAIYMAILFANNKKQWNMYLRKTNLDIEDNNYSDDEDNNYTNNNKNSLNRIENKQNTNYYTQNIILDGKIEKLTWKVSEEHISSNWSIEDDTCLLGLICDYSDTNMGDNPFTFLQSMLENSNIKKSEEQIAYRLISLGKYNLFDVKDVAPHFFIDESVDININNNLEEEEETNNTNISQIRKQRKKKSNDINTIIRQLEDSSEEDLQWTNKPIENTKKPKKKRQSHKNTSRNLKKRKKRPSFDSDELLFEEPVKKKQCLKRLSRKSNNTTTQSLDLDDLFWHSSSDDQSNDTNNNNNNIEDTDNHTTLNDTSNDTSNDILSDITLFNKSLDKNEKSDSFLIELSTSSENNNNQLNLQIQQEEKSDSIIIEFTSSESNKDDIQDTNTKHTNVQDKKSIIYTNNNNDESSSSFEILLSE